MAGEKHDKGKLDWHALPLELVELLVPVAVAGAKKCPVCGQYRMLMKEIK